MSSAYNNKELLLLPPSEKSLWENIDFSLKKNPSWRSLFKALRDNAYGWVINCYREIEMTVDKILTYKKAIKNINPDSYLKYSKTKNIYELWKTILSEIDDSILNWRIDKYIKTLFSSKHRVLIDSKIKRLIKFIYQNYEKEYAVAVKTKISKYNTREDLYAFTREFVLRQCNWEKESYVSLFRQNKASIIYQTETQLWIEIQDFKQAKNIVPLSWCIQSSEQDFFEYVKIDKERKLLVRFDFGCLPLHKNSIIGITVDMDKEIVHAYDYYNEDLTFNIEDIKRLKIPRSIAEVPKWTF